MKNETEDRERLHCYTPLSSHLHSLQDPQLPGCRRKWRSSSLSPHVNLEKLIAVWDLMEPPRLFSIILSTESILFRIPCLSLPTPNIQTLTPASEVGQQRLFLVLMPLSENYHNISYPSPWSLEEGDTELSTNTDKTLTDLKALKGHRTESE